MALKVGRYPYNAQHEHTLLAPTPVYYLAGMNIYISVGNSDVKLTQDQWSEYVNEVRDLLRVSAIKIYGEWYSASGSPHQNACFCAAFSDAQKEEQSRSKLTAIRQRYYQDSIAWARADTEFI